MVVTICVKVTTTVPVRMKEMMLVKRPLIGRKIVLDPLGGPIDDSKTALDGTRSILTFISIPLDGSLVVCILWEQMLSWCVMICLKIASYGSTAEGEIRRSTSSDMTSLKVRYSGPSTNFPLRWRQTPVTLTETAQVAWVVTVDVKCICLIVVTVTFWEKRMKRSLPFSALWAEPRTMSRRAVNSTSWNTFNVQDLNEQFKDQASRLISQVTVSPGTIRSISSNPLWNGFILQVGGSWNLLANYSSVIFRLRFQLLIIKIIDRRILTTNAGHIYWIPER